MRISLEFMRFNPQVTNRADLLGGNVKGVIYAVYTFMGCQSGINYA